MDNLTETTDHLLDVYLAREKLKSYIDSLSDMEANILEARVAKYIGTNFKGTWLEVKTYGEKKDMCYILGRGNKHLKNKVLVRSVDVSLPKEETLSTKKHVSLGKISFDWAALSELTDKSVKTKHQQKLVTSVICKLLEKAKFFLEVRSTPTEVFIDGVDQVHPHKVRVRYGNRKGYLSSWDIITFLNETIIC